MARVAVVERARPELLLVAAAAVGALGACRAPWTDDARDPRLAAAPVETVDEWQRAESPQARGESGRFGPHDRAAGPARAVACSSSGAWVASSSMRGPLLVWSPRDLRLRAELDPGMTVSKLLFTDDDRTLVVAGGDGVRAFDLESGSSRWIASWRFATLQSAAISADGRALAAGALGSLFVWDAQRGRRVFELRIPEANHAQAVAFSPDARRIASAWADGHARIHRVGSARSHCDVDLRTDQARELVWSEDGATLFVATGDPNGGSIVTIDAADCTVRSVLREPSRGWIDGLAKGPGSLLAAVARERLLVVDAAQSTVVEARALGARDLGEVAWCGRGGPIVAASDDGYVYVVAPGGAAP